MKNLKLKPEKNGNIKMNKTKVYAVGSSKAVGKLAMQEAKNKFVAYKDAVAKYANEECSELKKTLQNHVAKYAKAEGPKGIEGAEEYIKEWVGHRNKIAKILIKEKLESIIRSSKKGFTNKSFTFTSLYFDARYIAEDPIAEKLNQFFIKNNITSRIIKSTAGKTGVASQVQVAVSWVIGK